MVLRNIFNFYVRSLKIEGDRLSLSMNTSNKNAGKCIESCNLKRQKGFDAVEVFTYLCIKEVDLNLLYQDIALLIAFYLNFDNTIVKRQPNLWEEWIKIIRPLVLKYKVEAFLPSVQEGQKFSLLLSYIAYTFPETTFLIMSNPEIKERPVHMLCMNKFEGFRETFRTGALFALLPVGGKWGGLVKALLHHEVIEYGMMHKLCMSSYNDMLECIIQFGMAMLKTSLVPQNRRETILRELNISDAHMNQWSETFDSMYPEHKDVHKCFRQCK